MSYGDDENEIGDGGLTLPVGAVDISDDDAVSTDFDYAHALLEGDNSETTAKSAAEQFIEIMERIRRS